MRRFDFTKSDSSQIAIVDYSPETQVLGVVFHSNREVLYVHENVPPHVAGNLIFADSLGKAYNELVKGKYPFGKEAFVIEPRPGAILPSESPHDHGSPDQPDESAGDAGEMT